MKSSPESEPSERENDDEPGKSLKEVAILMKFVSMGNTDVEVWSPLSVLQLLVLIGSSTRRSL